MFCSCLSWRMNYYEIMFLGFIIIYISEWASIIWEISSDAVPLRKTRALVHRRRREGAGGTSRNKRWGVCSMLPESLTLPQTKIRNLPSLMSAFKRRVIERNIPYSRALIHNGQAYSVYTPKRGQRVSHYLYNLNRSILQYIAYIRRYHFPQTNWTVRNKYMYTLSSRERKNSSLGNYTIISCCDNENL